jgi:hypothetical protein
LKITYEGQVYDLDMDEIDVKQASKIEQHVGGTLTEWEEGMGKASVRCLQALGWLIFTGGDLSADIADTNFKVMKLGKAVAAAQQAEADEPRPTAAGSPAPATST